jgi:phosphate starvation-inducible protein PhoH and related proteins
MAKDEAISYKLFGVDFGSNPEQREFVRLMRLPPSKMPLIYCLGDAGTGKTFVSLAASLSLVRGKGASKKYKTIYYIREPIEVGHRLGYLKGGEEEKYAPYLWPLLDNYFRLMEYDKSEAKSPQKGDKIRNTSPSRDDALPYAYRRLPSDIVPLAPEFLRGRSFEDCLLLVDEAQNMSLDEFQTISTRIGSNCKLVFLGSTNQIDAKEQSESKNDFLLSYEILKSTGLVGMVRFIKPMRSAFVAEFDEAFVSYRKKQDSKAGN